MRGIYRNGSRPRGQGTAGAIHMVYNHYGRLESACGAGRPMFGKTQRRTRLMYTSRPVTCKRCLAKRYMSHIMEDGATLPQPFVRKRNLREYVVLLDAGSWTMTFEITKEQRTGTLRVTRGVQPMVQYTSTTGESLSDIRIKLLEIYQS